MAEHELIGDPSSLVWVAVKAILLFLTAVAGFRIAERRTLAEMGPYDFVAAVACGAIVGRVPNSTTTAYVQGAVTLVAIFVAHAVITRLRYVTAFVRLLDHAPRLLVRRGEIVESALHRSGLTHADLFALLRTHGITTLDEVRYVIFESRGSITIVRADAAERESEILAIVHSGERRADAGGKLPHHA